MVDYGWDACAEYYEGMKHGAPNGDEYCDAMINLIGQMKNNPKLPNLHKRVGSHGMLIVKMRSSKPKFEVVVGAAKDGRYLVAIDVFGRYEPVKISADRVIDVIQFYLQKLETLPEEIFSTPEKLNSAEMLHEDYYIARLSRLPSEWQSTELLRRMQFTLAKEGGKLRRHLVEEHSMDNATRQQLHALMGTHETMSKLVEAAIDLDVEQRSRQLLEQLERQDRKP